jgi:hypothetical protein
MTNPAVVPAVVANGDPDGVGVPVVLRIADCKERHGISVQDHGNGWVSMTAVDLGRLSRKATARGNASRGYREAIDQRDIEIAQLNGRLLNMLQKNARLGVMLGHIFDGFVQTTVDNTIPTPVTLEHRESVYVWWVVHHGGGQAPADHDRVVLAQYLGVGETMREKLLDLAAMEERCTQAARVNDDVAGFMDRMGL